MSLPGRFQEPVATLVLLTGMIWGRVAWGRWWAWTPRLTFSLLLWLLYVVYLIIRPAIESRPRRALICAVYAVVAFLDVPLVYLSARLIPDYVHPRSVQLIGPMKLTLAAWFVPVTLLTAGLIEAARNRNRLRRQRELERPAETAWSFARAEATDPTGNPHCNGPAGDA